VPSTSSSSTEPDDPLALLEVGHVVRAHGLRGDIVIALITDRPERVDVGSVLFTDRGPLRISASRPDRDKWLVRIEGIDTREAAEPLRGLVLRAEPLDDPDVLWIHEMIGGRVIDSDGVERGTVVAVLDNPASDLLELDTGPLVPLRFVVGMPANGVIRVDVPEGLWDL
jgi:16S rRNA processing protein RimM